MARLVAVASAAALLADLRRQRQEFERAGYDGHNRKPQPVPMRALGQRRYRRRGRAFLRELAEGWT